MFHVKKQQTCMRLAVFVAPPRSIHMEKISLFLLVQFPCIYTPNPLSFFWNPNQVVHLLPLPNSNFSDQPKMRRNCNLELRLFPTSDQDHHRITEEYSKEQQQLQQITIFYNGNVCAGDVTEQQARAILMLARQETEAKMRINSSGSSSSSSTSSSEQIVSPTVASPPPVYSPNMKISLQRFLEKRNHRIQTTYPYNINRRPHMCRVDHWAFIDY